MILLDRDLQPHPARTRHAAAPAVAWARDPLPWARRLPAAPTLNRFLARAQAAVKLRGQVSVLLTTDRRIRTMNRLFRGVDKATDVLSFPALDLSQSGPAPTAPASQRICGDLAISIETARRQAAEQGHALACELKILILHGLLHLAGYDHETDAGGMAKRERALRARFALPHGLIERTERHGPPIRGKTRKTETSAPFRVKRTSAQSNDAAAAAADLSAPRPAMRPAMRPAPLAPDDSAAGKRGRVRV